MAFAATAKKFHRFLIHNLFSAVNNKVLLIELYESFRQEKWKDDDLLEDPVNIQPRSLQFLELLDTCETKKLDWWKTSREFQVPDNMIRRCVQHFNEKYIEIKLPHNRKTDLNVLQYMVKINKAQISVLVPKAYPMITGHTVRLMRELYLLAPDKYNDMQVRTNEEQLKAILSTWFDQTYTRKKGSEVGYARRQLMQEANDHLESLFGPDKNRLYVHHPVWQWLLQDVMYVVDNNTQYARLPIVKRNGEKNNYAATPAGDHTITKRMKKRKPDRELTDLEKDALRKEREKQRRLNTENKLETT